MLSSHAASLQYGYRWAASARDQPMPPLTGVAARLERALRNFMETFPLFAAAVLVASVIDRPQLDDGFGGATLFLGAFSIRAAICHGRPAGSVDGLERCDHRYHLCPGRPGVKYGSGSRNRQFAILQRIFSLAARYVRRDKDRRVAPVS